MRSSNWTPMVIVGAIVIVLAFIGGRYLYYGSATNSYVPPERELEPVSIESAEIAPRDLETVDNPEMSSGVVVMDYAHDNALFIEELNTLFSKIVARGFSYEVVTPEQNETEGERLIDRLSYANSVILPLVRREYTPEEIVALEEFVDQGGRIFLIGDPTRTVIVEALNSIAGSFGIVYINDYLYSLERNDNNYRNVIFTEFSDSPITEGIGDDDSLVFYASGSIQAPGHEIIMGDSAVESSTSEGGRTKSVGVLTTDDKVLALGDLTFFTEPYSAVESNETLINNIADFLTTGERSYEIRDFPYFLTDNVDIVFDDTLVFNSQFEGATKLRTYLEDAERTVNFTNEIGDDNDVIFIGRFDGAEAVEDYLDDADIVLLEPEPEDDTELTEATAESSVVRVSDSTDAEETEGEAFVQGRIQIDGVGELEQGGATLFYRHQEDGQNILIVLSEDAETNTDAFDLLLEGGFGECVVDPAIAVCQTQDPGERLAPSLRSTRIDKILVVSDNDGRVRADAQTGALAYNQVLSATYQIEQWVTTDDGSPDLEELQEYDAVIWSTGDYWDDSIGEEDVATLQEYVTAGGNLLLSGASIAFDWDHTDFVTDIVHADYLTAAEQQDIEVALPDHPIADDFEPGAVITFTDTPSGESLLIDVVAHTADSRVVFTRGPDSQQTGAASVIAYEDSRSKIAYYAFPYYLLTPDNQALLVDNTIDWFTRRPVELPSESDYDPYELDDSPTEEPAPEDGEEEGTEEGEGGEDGDTGDGEENGDEGGDDGEGGDEGGEGGDEGGEGGA